MFGIEPIVVDMSPKFCGMVNSILQLFPFISALSNFSTISRNSTRIDRNNIRDHDSEYNHWNEPTDFRVGK